MQIQARSFLVDASSDPEGLKKRLRSIERGALVQTVKAGCSSNARHLEMIAAQTLRASETGNLLAEKPEIDFLLRVAGTTQIARAMEEAGTSKGEPFLVVIAKKRGLGSLARPRRAKELPRRKLSGQELESIERAALLNALRA